MEANQSNIQLDQQSSPQQKSSLLEEIRRIPGHYK